MSYSLQLSTLSTRKRAHLANTTNKLSIKNCALHRHTVKTKIQENIQTTQETITVNIKQEDHCLLRWRVHNTRRPLRLPKQHKTTANNQPPPAMAWEIWCDPHAPNHRKRAPTRADHAPARMSCKTTGLRRPDQLMTVNTTWKRVS